MPPRVRMEVGAFEWQRLPRADRGAIGVLCRAHAVGWERLYGDALRHVATAHRSSPLDADAAARVVAGLRDHGVAPREVHCPRSRYLARVRVGGAWVVFGAGAPLPDRSTALVMGVPLAVVAGGGVAPWEGHVSGHTDAELLGAAVHADAAPVAA